MFRAISTVLPFKRFAPTQLPRPTSNLHPHSSSLPHPTLSRLLSLLLTHLKGRIKSRVDIKLLPASRMARAAFARPPPEGRRRVPASGGRMGTGQGQRRSVCLGHYEEASSSHTTEGARPWLQTVVG